MRENVLRNLVSRAASNPEFLRQARQDLRGTIARHGYRLTNEEPRLVENFLRKTAAMTGVQLTGTLDSGEQSDEALGHLSCPTCARLLALTFAEPKYPYRRSSSSAPTAAI